MASQDILFTLIKSLESGERRALSKRLGVHKKDAKQRALFDALLAESVYDKAAFEQKHRNIRSDFISRLSANKSYLQDRVLEFLVSQKHGENISSSLQFQLCYFPELYEKKQYKLMLKKISKGIALARKHEHFNLLVDFLEWEKKVVWNDHQNKHKRSISEILDEQALALEQQAQQFAYRNLRRRLDLHTRKDGTLYTASSRVKFKSICDSPLLEQGISFLSQEAEMHYYHMLVEVCRKKGDHQGMMRHACALVALFESYGRKDHPDYGMALSKYLLVAHQAGDYAEFQETIEKWRVYLTQEKHLDELNIYVKMSYWKLIGYLNTNEFDAAEQLVEEIEARWEDLLPKLATGKWLTLSFNVMVYYWINDDLKSGLRWLESITLSRGVDRRKDVVNGTRLFQLIFYYEYFLQGIRPERDLENKIDSTRQVVERDEYANLILRSASALCKTKNRRDSLPVIEQLQIELESLENPSKEYFGRAEILLWCQAKLQGCSMLELRRSLV